MVMKKLSILSMVVLLAAFASYAMADEGDRSGKLFLFQKCDQDLAGTAGYDSFGCPNIGSGPWAIFPDQHRHGNGVLKYSLWGEKFAFSFEGHKLLPKKDYTLIYYPDPWPGTGLICLGSGTVNRGGNLQIHGKRDIAVSLPAPHDANYSPVSPSGAVGAKIWLVLSEDVQCSAETQMLNWNPAAYLFEYNLIVYERRDEHLGDDRNHDHDCDRDRDHDRDRDRDRQRH
jgi:hypothetical protein